MHPRAPHYHEPRRISYPPNLPLQIMDEQQILLNYEKEKWKGRVRIRGQKGEESLVEQEEKH